MADFITQFTAEEYVSRDNFNSRIAEANAALTTINTKKLDTDGNGSNVTVAFSQAESKMNIASGEKLSVIFGKLMKWFASFGAAAWMNTGTTSGTVALGNHTHTAAAVGAVPTSRTVNGKALSSDVTLAAGDVLYASFEALGLTEATATIENIVTAMGDRTVLCTICDTAGAGTGLVPGTYGLLHVTKWNEYFVKFEFQRSGGMAWRGYYNAASSGGKWSGWLQTATNTPPKWYDLTPVGSYTVGTAFLKYCKNGCGSVLLTGAVRKSSAPTSAETIAILPEGFRPANYISFVVAQMTTTAGGAWSAVCCVEPSGIVRFFAGTTPSNFFATNDLIINVAFPAATV